MSKPDDFELEVEHYYYVNNHYDSIPSGYTGTPSITWSDFEEISSTPATAEAQKTFENLYPGSKMTFCIKVTASSTMTSLYLKLKGLTSVYAGEHSKRYDITGEYDASKKIAMAQGIKIYTGYSANTTMPSLTSSFTYVRNTQNYILSSTASGVGTIAYLFYTVEFSNDSSAKYIEYTTSAGTTQVTTTPKYNSGSNRYFRQDNNGDSNCFENLTFSIPELEVSTKNA